MHCVDKTSNNGPSEKRTTSLQQIDHLPPIDFRTSEKRISLNSVQRTLMTPMQSQYNSTSENGQ